MTGTVSPQRATAALIVAAALALSGCSGSTTSAAQTSSSTPQASAEATASEQPVSGADCLIGTWTADQEGLASFYADVTAAMESGVEFRSDGTAKLTLADSESFTWAPDVTVTMTTAGAEMIVTLGGTISGTYAATDSTITTDAVETENVVIEATANGTPIDASQIDDSIIGAPLTDASYVCTDDTLVLETSVGSTTATTTLHRG